MTSTNKLFALIKKEYLELVRDQRSLFATFAYALFGPLLLFVLIKGIIGTAMEQTKVVVGIQQDAQYETAIADIQHFLTTKNIETLLYDGDLPSTFDASIDTSLTFDTLVKVHRPINATSSQVYVIEVFGDRSSEKLAKKLDATESLLAGFVSQQQQDALFKQGVSPVNKTWSLRTHEVNNQTIAANQIMESLLIFLLLAPFFITLNYINDATAGERERGSLIPLLTQPMDRQLLALSKWGIGSLLGIIGTAVTMLIGFELMGTLPLYEIGVRLNASIYNLILTMIIIAPLALLVASLQMWIALAAKSFKEGQSYLTIFGFVPMVAVFMASKFEGLAWSKVTPLVGHQQMLKSIFSNQDFDLIQFSGLSTICILLSVAALYAVRYQFNSESILQGR